MIRPALHAPSVISVTHSPSNPNTGQQWCSNVMTNVSEPSHSHSLRGESSEGRDGNG